MNDTHVFQAIQVVDKETRPVLIDKSLHGYNKRTRSLQNKTLKLIEQEQEDMYETLPFLQAQTYAEGLAMRTKLDPAINRYANITIKRIKQLTRKMEEKGIGELPPEEQPPLKLRKPPPYPQPTGNEENDRKARAHWHYLYGTNKRRIGPRSAAAEEKKRMYIAKTIASLNNNLLSVLKNRYEVPELPSNIIDTISALNEKRREPKKKPYSALVAGNTINVTASPSVPAIVNAVDELVGEIEDVHES